MADQSENMKQVDIITNCANRIRAAVTAYENGKVTLFNGADVPFSAEQVTALKADFVATKASMIAALNAIAG